MSPSQWLAAHSSEEITEQMAFDRLDADDAERAQLEAEASAGASARSRAALGR